MKIENVFTGFVLLTSITIFSCASVASVTKSISIESGVIPPEMAKEKFVLIGVLQNRKSYDKYLISGFKENYFGEYVLTELKEIDLKYPDKNKYRYILDYSTRVTPTSSFNGKTMVTTNTTAYIYYIIDRVSVKKYTRANGSSFFCKRNPSHAQGY